MEWRGLSRRPQGRRHPHRGTGRVSRGRLRRAHERAAQAIKSQIRSDDELVRYGGDEFFLLFRDLPQQILEKKLQSIRAALDEIVIEEYPELHISASIGGAFAAGRISRTIRRADLAMYQAKLKKDCVAIYREAKERET